MQRAEPLRVGDRVTAEALVAGVLGNMAALEAVLAEEAAYVREGRLQEGVAAAEPKAIDAARNSEARKLLDEVMNVCLTYCPDTLVQNLIARELLFQL